MQAISTTLCYHADTMTLKNERIDEKIIGQIVDYELHCRNAREEVKDLIIARDREIAKKKSLQNNSHSRNRSLNENEIMLSNMQISKVIKELYSIAETFERQKLNDTKEILTNFILIQLKYFATGLQLYTEAYENISQIDEKSDLEVVTLILLNNYKFF